MRFRSCLIALLLCLSVSGVLRAQDGEIGPHSLPQTRLEGTVRTTLAAGSLELSVVSATTPSGRRTYFKAAVPRKVKVLESSFVFDRFDPSVFHTAADLKPGDVVIVRAAEADDGDLIAAEILVGGKLSTAPKAPPRAVPDEPDVDPLSIRLPPLPAGPAKFEPGRGCYLGAFVMRDANVDGRMDEWEAATGKGHASYLRYVGYGQPFPTAWVREVRALGAVPNIALEPNGGLGEVRDGPYLRKWARAAGASGGPVFLRFASEMNGAWTAYTGNPRRYRATFRRVTRVMREEAPNVAMVWTPYCRPNRNIPDYYPGDDAVDWVGINIYSVHHHDGNLDSPAEHEDPTELLAPVYARYSGRKPIQISEYAATSFCLACGREMPAFAIRKMERLYSSLPKRFPRVKMIYWFSWDTISGGAAENNYAVTGNPAILRSYQRLTRSPYFLARLRGVER
jgi:hypothetical protein